MNLYHSEVFLLYSWGLNRWSIRERRRFFCFLISCQVTQCSLLSATAFWEMAPQYVGSCNPWKAKRTVTATGWSCFGFHQTYLLCSCLSATSISSTAYSLSVCPPTPNANNVDFQTLNLHCTMHLFNSLSNSSLPSLCSHLTFHWINQNFKARQQHSEIFLSAHTSNVRQDI